MKALVASDNPVILFMTCEPDGGGGHYRTSVGYDDIAGVIHFSDPWRRDLKHQTDKTGITAWTYEELQSGWNYTAEGESHIEKALKWTMMKAYPNTSVQFFYVQFPFTPPLVPAG